MPADIRLNIRSDDLADLERRLNRKLGPRAAQKFLNEAATSAIREAESLTVRHLSASLSLPTSLVREHIYFRSAPGKDKAVVAWSPTRTIPVKKLNPVQTATGVSWTFAGRRRSRRHAFIGPGGHVAIRKKRGGQLVPRLPIVRVRGPRIGWDAQWNDTLGRRIESHMADALTRWLDSPA